MSIHINVSRSHSQMGSIFSALVEDGQLMREVQTEILREVIDNISSHIAAEFVEKHGPEIAARISPDAIANLTIAAGAAQINETLHKKMPDKIIHHVEERMRTEVYQRGIFGGLKRL